MTASEEGISSARLRIERWDADRAWAAASNVYAVYDAVFGDMASEEAWREATYEKHVQRIGFRLVAALDDDALVGFAYGYVGERGQYWADKVVAALPQQVSDVWVGGHFDFVELAVLPAFRGRGIGSRLHDALLEGAPAGRALLSTDAHDSPAVRLYQSRGWRKLGMLSDDVQVMGVKIRR